MCSFCSFCQRAESPRRAALLLPPATATKKHHHTIVSERAEVYLSPRGIPLRRGISPSAGNRKRQGILGLPKTFASHSTVTLELADSVVPSEPSSHVDSLALSHPVDAFTPTTPPNTPAVWNGFTGYSHGHRHPIPANSNPQIGGNMENAGDSKESFKEPSENCSHSSKLYADMRGNGQGDIFDEQRQHAHSLNQKLFAVQEQKSPVGYGANEFQQGDWNGYVVSKSVLPSINISLPTEMRAEETSLNVKKIETLNESIQSSGKETERSYYYARFSTDSLSSSQKSSTTSTEHFEQHYTTDSTGKQDNDLPQKQQTVLDKKTTDSKDGVSLRENANKEMQELHYSENEIGNEDSSERREHIDMPEIEDWEDYTEGSLFSRQRWNGKDRDEVLDAWERRSKMTASSKLNSKKSVNSNVNKQRLSSSPSVKPSVVIETHQKQAEQLAPVLWEDVALNISSDATTAQESAKQEVDNSSSKVPQDPVKSSMLPKSAPSLLLRTLQSPFSAMKSVTKGRPTILPEAEKQNDSMPDKQMAPNSNAPLPPAVYSTEQQPSVPAGRVAPNLNNPRAAWNEPTKVAKIVNAPVPPNAWNVQQSAAPNLSQQTRATLWNGQAVGQASETPSTLNQQMRSNSLNTQPSTAQNSYTQLPLQTTESKSSPAQQRPQTLGSGQLKLQLPTETARPGQPATSPTYAVPDMAKKTRQKVPIPQPPPKPKNSSLRNAYRKYIGKVMGTGTKLNHYTDDDDTISDEDIASATSTTESDYLTTAAIDASTPANNKEDDGNAAAKKREIAYIPTGDASTHESPHSASLHAAPRDAPADFISSGRREEALESGGQKSVTQQQTQLNDRRRPSMELEEQLHGPIG
uniref:Uncharacterized protein n=1 Tax=Plectus sambesii TaxID=2011161 RepID=A0A914VAE8_9BILA